MTPKRFKSKIDRWLLLLLIAIMVFEVVVMSIVATQVNSPREATVMIVAALAIVALIGSMLLGTHYTVSGNVLRIAPPLSLTEDEAAAGLDPLIIAESVTLEQTLEIPDGPMGQGDAATRTVTAKITGTSPLFIPECPSSGKYPLVDI